LVQTLVNAILLIGVTLIAGSIGLKRFEAIDRRFEALQARFEARFDAIDRRFEASDRRSEGRFEVIDGRFDGMDGRFESLERSFTASLTGAIDGLRNELKHDIALLDAHVGEVRTELAQTRSDLTYVALAVGARRAEG
jgi:hypothetical protein